MGLPPMARLVHPRVHMRTQDAQLNEHRLLRISAWNYIKSTRLLVLLSVPLIYACVFPFMLLDAFVWLFQSACFPIYGIPKVRRRNYVVFDRGRLAYLNAIEKVGCIYCSYANGLLAYITEIAARTEQHFCPIKHAHPVVQPHSRYPMFLPYGDAQAYRGGSEAVARDYDDIRPSSPTEGPPAPRRVPSRLPEAVGERNAT
jgi:hypothetical protein